MKSITSRDNPLYKELRQLAGSSQARRKAGRTLLDGVHLCEAYLQHVGKPALCVVAETAHSHPEIAHLLQRCSDAQVPCLSLSATLYQALSQVEHGKGPLFLVDTPQAGMPDSLEHDALLLDGLQDPGNMGSILRSAAAAGIVDVFCSRKTVFAWSPKVLRAGMGAHFVLQIRENVDLVELMTRARIPLLATSSHASVRIYDMDLRMPVAWAFGHEGQGISAELMQLAKQRVAIPHLGAVESLNVAASAAVCLFEQLRQKSAR